MMNLEQLFCRYADQFTDSESISADECMLMHGFAALYTKTKNPKYFTVVKNYVDGHIQTTSDISYALSYLLQFMFQQTNQEVYKTAIGQMAERLTNRIAKHDCCEPEENSMEHVQRLYFSYPFFAWYDTRFNKKENYLIIMNRLSHITKYLFGENEKDIIGKEYLMMMLTETADQMSEEIYEHYARVRSWVKKAVHINLNNAEINEAFMAYVLFRASDSKSILAEKYIQTATQMFERAVEKLPDTCLDVSEYANAGALMMAYSYVTSCKNV